jgi:hypothetical protein
MNGREDEIRMCYETINGLFTLFFFCEMEIDRDDVGIQVISHALFQLIQPRQDDLFNSVPCLLEYVLRSIDNI